jgi:hypothetical protein
MIIRLKRPLKYQNSPLLKMFHTLNNNQYGWISNVYNLNIKKVKHSTKLNNRQNFFKKVKFSLKSNLYFKKKKTFKKIKHHLYFTKNRKPRSFFFKKKNFFSKNAAT